jgi:DNA-directed RNA polymerase subunit RPC12/RpoP
MTEAETQDFQLKCLQCGAAVTARSDQAGEKLSCPSCSAPVLTAWDKLRRSVLHGLYSAVIHGVFAVLFILFAWPNSSCLPSASPAGDFMVALFPLHALGMMIPLAILGTEAAGLYTALLITVPISMLYTRAIVKLHAKMREKGCWWSLAVVLFILIVMFCLWVAMPLV